jgi:succinate dehydrogenase / fumarate reductase cytochrome b subunit
MSTVASTSSVAARVVHVTRKQVLTLFGIVPLGVYVFLHLGTNLYSLAGPEKFNAAVDRSRQNPAFLFLEVFGLGIPLLAHTVIGFMEIRRGRPNNLRYGFLDNLRYLLQRVSAVGLALFIGAHVWRARIAPDPQFTVNGHESFAGMHEALGEPITLTVYVLGMLGIAYHLANGLQTAATRTGLVVSEAGRRRMTWVAAFVMVLLLAMSGLSIAGFLLDKPLFS